MKREQLEHLLRAASSIVGERDILVIGSQAVLGSIPDEHLPSEATTSIEADLAVISKGLAEGDIVVTDRQNQLRPGGKVAPRAPVPTTKNAPSVTPGDSATPPSSPARAHS